MSNISYPVSEQASQEIKTKWLSSLQKYKPIFIHLQGVFEKKKAAFFNLISALIETLLKDLNIDYDDTDIEIVNLHTRRIFEILLIFYWINRHLPRETYIQFALEQINFCDTLLQESQLNEEAKNNILHHKQQAINGAYQLGIIDVTKEKFQRINFKHEADLAQLQIIYNTIYNISSVNLHGGLFSAKYKAEASNNLLYKHFLLTHIIEMFPLLHKELNKIKNIKNYYK